MSCRKVLLAFLVVFFVMNRSVCEIDFEIPDDWIDPSDMFNFDYAASTNHKHDDSEKKNHDQTKAFENIKQDENSDSDADKFVSLTEQKKKLESEIDENEHEHGTDPTAITLGKGVNDLGKEMQQNVISAENTCTHPFLHRFVGVLRRKLEFAGSPPTVEDFEMSLHLNSRNWIILDNFADDCNANIPEVSRVLEEMITNVGVQLKVSHSESLMKKFEDFFIVAFVDAVQVLACLILVVCILTLEIVSQISWTRQLKRIVAFGFIISFVMTYFHELKLAEADYKSKMKKDIPPECLNKQIQDTSIFGSLSSWYHDMFSVKKDPCAEYHANFLIKPHLTVTPTKVVAVTLTRFLVEPMEHTGTAFSKAFKNIFQDLPITLWIPAFLFVVLIIIGFLLIVSVCFGYNFSFNLPFWTGLQMGPQNNVQHPQLDLLLEDKRRHIDHLETTIRELKEQQQQALPAPAPEVSPSRAKAILGYFGLGGGSSAPEAPLPPPYPPTQNQESNLPYPDFNSPPYQPEEVRGPSDVHGHPYGPPPFEDTVPPLRRRKTAPVIRSQRSSTMAQGDGGSNYPQTVNKQRSTSCSTGLPIIVDQRQNLIGFEHFMTEQGPENNPIDSPKIPVQPEGEESHRARENQNTVTKSVEDIPIRAHIPLELSQSNRNVIDTQNTLESGDSREEVANVRKTPVKEFITEDISYKNYENEVETLPVQDVVQEGAGCQAPLPDDGDWEKVFVDCDHKNDCDCVCKQLSSAELQNIFEKEAAEGISTDLKY